MGILLTTKLLDIRKGCCYCFFRKMGQGTHLQHQKILLPPAISCVRLFARRLRQQIVHVHSFFKMSGGVSTQSMIPKSCEYKRRSEIDALQEYFFCFLSQRCFAPPSIPATLGTASALAVNARDSFQKGQSISQPQFQPHVELPLQLRTGSRRKADRETCSPDKATVPELIPAHRNNCRTNPPPQILPKAL